MKKPTLWVKFEDEPEINAESITPNFMYLDDHDDPTLTNNYQEDAGMDGSIFANSSYGKSIVNGRFYLKFGDWYDFKMKSHAIHAYFNRKGIYRIRTDAEPAIVKFVRSADFTIEPAETFEHYALFTIPWENPSGLKYSLGYSDDLMTYKRELWQVGMNLPAGENLQYEFAGQSRFQVYNASDITVDPLQHHQLQIIVKNNSGVFGLKNETTGEELIYTDYMQPKDVLMWDGPNCYLNGKLANTKTDYTVPTLAPGYNTIQMRGNGKTDVRFHFRFIYIN